MDYNVRYTDNTKNPITIKESTKDDTSLDITLFGRIDLEYGEELNAAMLHILERFACPQDAASTPTNTFPDYNINGDSLRKPTQGQLWFNSTVKKIYVWNGTSWESLRTQGNISANWGQILDGSQIPRPVNPANGYVYQYSECIWAVSPAYFPTAFTYMACTTDSDAKVYMKYRAYGDNELTSGIANYLIIAISGNTNHGSLSVTPLTPFVSQTPTPTPTPSVTPTISITPTSSLTPSPIPSPSPTPSPSITATPSHTAAVSPSPAASVTPSPTNSPTPTPSPTPPVSVTPTPSPFQNACSRCVNADMECCVAINSFLPDGKLAGDIKINDTMILADQTTLEPDTGIVTYSEPSLQPCVRIVTESGASLVCSTTAPIPTTEGLFKAPDVFGKDVAVMVNDKAAWDKVVSLQDVGEQWVQHITVENKCFWAGENSNAFILHHNIKYCYVDHDPPCNWMPPNCCLCP